MEKTCVVLIKHLVCKFPSWEKLLAGSCALLCLLPMLAEYFRSTEAWLNSTRMFKAWGSRCPAPWKHLLLSIFEKHQNDKYSRVDGGDGGVFVFSKSQKSERCSDHLIDPIGWPPILLPQEHEVFYLYTLHIDYSWVHEAFHFSCPMCYD